MPTEAEVAERWKRECEEWDAIREEFFQKTDRVSVVAAEITKEQRRRMKARGEDLLCYDEEACKVLGFQAKKDGDL